MKFYSVVLRKKIDIPEKDVRYVIKKGRKFAVGKYTAKKMVNGKMTPKKYEAWMVVGMSKPKAMKKKVMKKKK